jgi:hypothetical protein
MIKLSRARDLMLEALHKQDSQGELSIQQYDLITHTSFTSSWVVPLRRKTFTAT